MKICVYENVMYGPSHIVLGTNLTGMWQKCKKSVIVEENSVILDSYPTAKITSNSTQLYN